MPRKDPHTPHHGLHHAPRRAADSGVQAEILDLDAEVLAEHIAAIAAWLPVEAAPREIVDLGCGTGAGSFALLARFPEAHITAVDSSAEHLHRLREKAGAKGVQQRVRTVQADLDAADWPDLRTPDLIWASASMHHMANPDRALCHVHDALTPGGLFAVVELSARGRLPDEPTPADVRVHPLRRCSGTPPQPI